MLKKQRPSVMIDGRFALGKLTLYQLSYSRRYCNPNKVKGSARLPQGTVVSTVVPESWGVGLSVVSRSVKASSCCSTRYSITSDRCRTCPRCLHPLDHVLRAVAHLPAYASA